MKRTSRAITTLLTVVLLSSLGCNPGDRSGGEPVESAAGAARQTSLEPVDLLSAANKALLEARWLDFEFEYVATHAGRGRVTGRATVEPVDRDLSRSRFLIDATIDMPVAWLQDLPSRVLVAQDGRTAWRADRETGRVERATTPDGIGWSPTINLANTVLPVQLFRQRPMSVEIDDPVSHRWAGTARVGDVLCDVAFLAFEPESGLGEQYFYLGREDHLPRRIILTNVEQTPMGPPMAFDLTLTNLRVGSDAPDASFEPDLPEGTEVVDRDLDQLAPGDIAPAWRLVDLEGGEVDSGDLRGSVVVLEFWATWCPTCRATLPHLERIRERFENRPVEVFAVQTWDDADPRPYLDETGLDLRVLPSGDSLANRLKVYGTSQNIVIDPEGRIVLHDLLFPLAEREETLSRAIRTALGESESP